MTATTIVKIVFLVLITILAIAIFVTPSIVNRQKRPEQQKIRLIVRTRMIIFVVMLVLLLIVFFI